MLGTVLSTLLGVATGAIVGVFEAPTSGKELRRKIVDETKHLSSDLHEVQDSLNDVRQSFHHLTQTLQTMIPQMKEDVEELKRAAEFQLNPRIQRVQQSIQILQQDLAAAKGEEEVKNIIVSPLTLRAPSYFVYEQLLDQKAMQKRRTRKK